MREVDDVMQTQIHKERQKRGATSRDAAPKKTSDLTNQAMLGIMESYQDNTQAQVNAFNIDEVMRQRMQRFQSNQRPDAEREADKISASVSGAKSPEEVKSSLGEKMGADFSGVSFHTGAGAAQKADGIGARAYTTGSDIFFGIGGFDANVAAHELVHTAQQGAVQSGVSTVAAPMGGVQMLPWGKKKKEEPKMPLPMNVMSDDDKEQMFEKGARGSSGNSGIRKLKAAYLGNTQSNLLELAKKMGKRGKGKGGFKDLATDTSKKEISGIGIGQMDISDTGLSLAGEVIDTLSSSLDDEGAQQFIKEIAANSGGSEFKSSNQSFSEHIMSILPTRGFNMGAGGVMDSMTKKKEKVEQKFGKVTPKSKESKQLNKEMLGIDKELSPLHKPAMEVDKIVGKMEHIKKAYDKDPKGNAHFGPILAKYNAYRSKALGIALPSARDEVQGSLTDDEKAISRPQQQQPQTGNWWDDAEDTQNVNPADATHKQRAKMAHRMLKGLDANDPGNAGQLEMWQTMFNNAQSEYDNEMAPKPQAPQKKKGFWQKLKFW